MPSNNKQKEMTTAGSYYRETASTNFFNGKNTKNFDNGGVVDGSTLGKDTIIKVVYPPYLAQDEYANRRITFIASEKTTSHYDTESLSKSLDTVKQTIRNSVSDVTNKVNEMMGVKTSGNVKSTSSFFDMLSKCCITVPLPERIVDNQTHNWTTETGIIHDVASSTIGQAVNDLKSEFLSYIAGDKTSTMRNYVASAADSIDLNKLIGAAADTMGFRKPMLNPNYWQNYTGSQPRNFGLDIDFIPQNQEESLTVKKIITLFKAYSSPSVQTAGITLIAPHYWDIMIANADISDMFRLDNLVLTNISVTYGADGKMALHGDGMPKHIQLSLSFIESHLTYMQNYLGDHQEWFTDRNSQFTDAKGMDVNGKNGTDLAKQHGLNTGKPEQTMQTKVSALKKNADNWLNSANEKYNQFKEKVTSSDTWNQIQESISSGWDSAKTSVINLLPDSVKNKFNSSDDDQNSGGIV